MSKTVRIYTLADPRNGEVRYVGRTVNKLSRRLNEHVRCAKRGKLKDKQKEDWIKNLLAEGLQPTITLIQNSDLDNFQSDEKRWVKHYRELQSDLLNIKEGGDGSLGGHFVQWDAESKALLGVLSDSKVAKVMGVTRKAIVYWREQFGIAPSFDRTDAKPPPPMGGHNRIDFPEEVMARFGKEPDHKIADSIGVDKSVVACRRRAMGIASYAEATGERGCFKKGMPHPRWSRQSGTIAAPTTI